MIYHRYLSLVTKIITIFIFMAWLIHSEAAFTVRKVKFLIGSCWKLNFISEPFEWKFPSSQRKIFYESKTTTYTVSISCSVFCITYPYSHIFIRTPVIITNLQGFVERYALLNWIQAWYQRSSNSNSVDITKDIVDEKRGTFPLGKHWRKATCATHSWHSRRSVRM